MSVHEQMKRLKDEQPLAELSSQMVTITSAGVMIFLLSLGVHQRYQWGQWRRTEQNLAVLFPGQPLQEEPEA